jgi:hypothetical protein
VEESKGKRYSSPGSLRTGQRLVQAVFAHCIANKSVSSFLFLYRVLKLGHPVAEAEFALHHIWMPDPVWQDFIDRSLRTALAPG